MAVSSTTEPESEDLGRRDFLARASSAAMTAGLVAGYGGFAGIALRYLYPARATPTHWLYVTRVAALEVGASLLFETPSGATAAVARRGESGGVEDFVALGSVCPHLGCRVHWEAPRNRFFCPCHGGAFDADGKATAGPPADAGQSLSRYALKVEDGLLYIEVPVDRELARSAERRA